MTITVSDCTKCPDARTNDESKTRLKVNALCLSDQRQFHRRSRPWIQSLYTILTVGLLFINYFLAQYDKFILSYFQSSFSTDLNLNSTQYGVLSGYATGIVYALLALPLAYFSDYLSSGRVWTLSLASLWWSLCVIFQGLSHSFWQVFLARFAMGIGQSVVGPLSVSLISDYMGEWRNVFFGCSVFYVGVYVGEAVSGQIASAFHSDAHTWRLALKAIGVTGIVVSALLRVTLREPARRSSILYSETAPTASREPGQSQRFPDRGKLRDTLRYLIRLRSFWPLLLSASFRQLSGNVFGFYMPSYLSSVYSTRTDLLSRYGIIVGVVGSVSVMVGGLLTQVFWERTRSFPIYLTAVGGMVSAVFVVVMVFSQEIAAPRQNRGAQILYGCLVAAYLTAETWLGAMDALIASILPPRHKSFGLAIWSSFQTLIYSSGPEIVGLALRNTQSGSPAYVRDLRIVLAVVIPAGYWIAGIGFLSSIPLLSSDFQRATMPRTISSVRKIGLYVLFGILALFVIILFTISIVYSVE